MSASPFLIPAVDLDPPCTAAAFAPVEDQGVVERAVLALPKAMS